MQLRLNSARDSSIRIQGRAIWQSAAKSRYIRNLSCAHIDAGAACNSAGCSHWREGCLGRSAEQIDQAVGALFALAFDLAVAHQAIEAGTRLAIIASANQPRNHRAGQPCPDRHHLQNPGLGLARPHALRSVAGAFGQAAQSREARSFSSNCIHEASGQAHRSPALRHAVRRHLMGHFFLGFIRSVPSGTAILSFNSVQVLRASAITNEQLSM
jgi:hypothetical protein